MSLLLLFGGAGTTSLTPIAFSKVCSILMADEIAIGDTWQVAMEVIDDTGNYSLSDAQVTVYGFNAVTSARTPVIATQTLTQFGSSKVYGATLTALTVAGTYEVVVAGVQAGTAFAVARALSVRSKFDPIALADSDVLAARTDGLSTIQTQP